ncbi:MAG: peptidoglycan bridge formation glycyltransferase FemA/FemB family protein [Spirochaetales bacterium]|nr:peptidoglycan bridge formation glycyltransferase FemA/FemB family protein [Spirochaetales bacterium]
MESAALSRQERAEFPDGKQAGKAAAIKTRADRRDRFGAGVAEFGVAAGAPSGLYSHPAWLAWKEGQGWTVRDAGIGVPVLTRSLGTGLAMAQVAAPFASGAASDRGDERGAILEALSRVVPESLGGDCAFIRWDLMAPAWTDGRGAPVAAWVEELRMNASTRSRNFRKAPVEGIAPDTMVVDLSGGADAVRARMEARARHAVTAAARRGTSVRELGPAGLGRFHALYRETASRRGFQAHPEASFARLFTEADRHGLGLSLYLAESGGEDAAAAIFARHGTEAWYLFAASSYEHRMANGPSAILDRALADASETGALRMDLLGVAPEGEGSHPLAGLSGFKASFGGVRMRRAGAWDWVLDHDAYWRWAQFEAGAARSGL